MPKATLIALLITIAALGTSHGQSYQAVFDGEDTCLHIKSGFVLDKTGSFLGNYKFSATGPGSGSSQCVWTLDGIPSGTYVVEFYCDNGSFTPTAEFIVEHDGGTETITRSQNNVGTGWHSLGTYTFTNAGRITQTDRYLASGVKVIADALRITHQGTPVAETVNVIAPAISICVDDLGGLDPNNASSYTGQLFNNCPDFMYAVMPSQPYGTTTLQAAQNKGIETILHQPMQYVGQADSNPSDAIRLYISMTTSQILTCLRNNLNPQKPYGILGCNNHQGSRFSQFTTGMNVVLGELKSQGYWFYDSRTITDSVAYDLSKQAGMLSGERDLFIDGVPVQQTIDYIQSIGLRAKYQPNYEYLTIAHQRTDSVPGLLQAQTVLSNIGVGIRRLSRNMHYIVETDALPVNATFTKTGAWASTTEDMMSHECSDGDAWSVAGGSVATATFTPYLPVEGSYRVFLGFGKGSNHGTAHVTVQHQNGVATKDFDQAVSPNRWHYVGTYSFQAGPNGNVAIDNSANVSPAQVIKADAVKWVYDGPAVAGIPDALSY